MIPEDERTLAAISESNPVKYSAIACLWEFGDYTLFEPGFRTSLAPYIDICGPANALFAFVSPGNVLMLETGHA